MRGFGLTLVLQPSVGRNSSTSARRHRDPLPHFPLNYGPISACVQVPSMHPIRGWVYDANIYDANIRLMRRYEVYIGLPFGT